MDSILTSIKKLLGIDDSYAAFDTDVIMGINSVYDIGSSKFLGAARAVPVGTLICALQ